MKKRLEKHIFDIATSGRYCYQYTDGETYYVLDGHRLITYGTELSATPGLCITAHDATIISNVKKFIATETECVRYELPTIEEIEKQISAVAGRAYSITVVYGNEKFAISARYMLKAMKALNATVCYINEVDPHKRGIFFYEDDNLNGPVKEMILPILRKDPNQVGFFRI